MSQEHSLESFKEWLANLIFKFQCKVYFKNRKEIELQLAMNQLETTYQLIERFEKEVKHGSKA